MLKSFLDKYDTIIFDMDGVMTSEQAYWDSAALTVWEYLHWNKKQRIDISHCIENVKEIRNKIFCNDELITILKSKGVNSNWDLGYITMCIAWIVGADVDDFSPVLEYANNMSNNILEEYDKIAKECAKKTGFDYDWLKRNNLMWNTMQRIFQEWYLGDELYIKQYGVPPVYSGKTGLIFGEKSLIPIETLRGILTELSKTKRICYATGRLSLEIEGPLNNWDCLKYFSEDGRITYDDVMDAEKEFNVTLTKPHPFVFLKAMLGESISVSDIIAGNYSKEKIGTTLIVGDAGADILAAKAINADFCATLTGVSGKKARGYFEEMSSEYIVDSLANFLED